MLALSVVVLAAATCAAADAPPAPEMHATVQLTADRTTFSAGAPVLVHVRITNPGRQRVMLLRWRTPLDGVTAALFAVTRDGVNVPYAGRMAKRPEPTDADYVTLEPGASVTTDVDIAQLYALETPGYSTVAYDVTSPQLRLPKRNAPASRRPEEHRRRRCSSRYPAPAPEIRCSFVRRQRRIATRRSGSSPRAASSRRIASSASSQSTRGISTKPRRA